MLRMLKSLALAGLALPFTQAVLVTPGSTCSTHCGNVLDSTVPNDITCAQEGYNGGQGQVFTGCVSCELRSGYSNANQTDTRWALYNLRYAVSYCLFGTPENENVISTPCITTKACGPFRDAIEFKNMSSDVTDYDYCAQWPVTDHADFKGCRECLRAGGQEYLANFFTVLQAGCEQQPLANVPVSTEGNIFSHDFVNVTAPSPIATIDPKWFDNGPISLGAKVGIAFGALVFILVVLGFLIVWNGKRRRRAYLAKLEQQHGHNGWPSPQQGQGDMRETPLSQRPLRGFDDSPLSAGTEKTHPRYFSPYSSQYNSPVSAQDTLNSSWPAMHHTHDPNYLSEHQSSFASRMAAMESSGQWVPTNPAGAYVHAPTPESYEMHEVDSAGSSSSRGKQRAWQEAPVLGHPGYGRTSNSLPRTYSPEDDDKRPGGA